MLYHVKRDLGLLPEYKFKLKLESFSKGKYYVSLPRDIYNDYGNRRLKVKVKICEFNFVTYIDVHQYSFLDIPNDIIQSLNLDVGCEIEIQIVEYIDSQDVEIPRELEELLSPISIRYFMFLSYTDKMKFINYIVAESDATKRIERAKYCVSLLESYKKFQDR